jgi:tripartite-type tricarboxylate transporter receptor subunit TctC
MKPEFPGYDVGRNGRMRRREFMLLFVGESVASRRACSDAVAQIYPTRPMTLVIPFPPCGKVV